MCISPSLPTCFQTKFIWPRFSFPGAEKRLAASLESICKYKKYHLLGHSVEKDKLYCLISLKPDDAVSVAARTRKCNLAREFNLQDRNVNREASESSLWSIGCCFGSVGKASKKSAEQYINNQGEHHGISPHQQLSKHFNGSNSPPT